MSGKRCKSIRREFRDAQGPYGRFLYRGEFRRFKKLYLSMRKAA